jgi:hypothetical protein
MSLATQTVLQFIVCGMWCKDVLEHAYLTHSSGAAWLCTAAGRAKAWPKGGGNVLFMRSVLRCRHHLHLRVALQCLHFCMLACLSHCTCCNTHHLTTAATTCCTVLAAKQRVHAGHESMAASHCAIQHNDDEGGNGARIHKLCHGFKTYVSLHVYVQCQVIACLL